MQRSAVYGEKKVPVCYGTLVKYRLSVNDKRWQSTDYRSVMNIGRVQTTGL